MPVSTPFTGPRRESNRRIAEERRSIAINKWFGNVEHVVAKRIGRETVQYVSNIAKYWVAYRLASRHLELREGGPS